MSGSNTTAKQHHAIERLLGYKAFNREEQLDLIAYRFTLPRTLATFRLGEVEERIERRLRQVRAVRRSRPAQVASNREAGVRAMLAHTDALRTRLVPALAKQYSNLLGAAADQNVEDALHEVLKRMLAYFSETTTPCNWDDPLILDGYLYMRKAVAMKIIDVHGRKARRNERRIERELKADTVSRNREECYQCLSGIAPLLWREFQKRCRGKEEETLDALICAAGAFNQNDDVVERIAFLAANLEDIESEIEVGWVQAYLGLQLGVTVNCLYQRRFRLKKIWKKSLDIVRSRTRM